MLVDSRKFDFVSDISDGTTFEFKNVAAITPPSPITKNKIKVQASEFQAW